MTTESIKEVETSVFPIGKIQTNGNVRKHFDEKRLDELTESIKKVGVLQPVLLRRVDDDFILIAGERRLRAAKAAGLKSIPARVLDVDEKLAAEIQALENLHRADLTPIEEAAAFKMLLEQGGYDVKALAQRVDKSEPYVYRAIRLLELPSNVLEAIEIGRLTKEHGHQILRVDRKRRDTIINFALTENYRNQLPDLASLKDQIEQAIEKKLSKAIFPINVEYAGQISCAGCGFNTGNQGMLFDGAQEGRCTNSSCYNKKTDQAYEDLEEKNAGKFEGVEFVGTAKENGIYSEDSIKGFPVVKEITPAVKKAMKETPEKFGWGILKPTEWGGLKKPKPVLLAKDPALAKKIVPGERVQTKEERGKDDFIRVWQKKLITAEIAEKLKKPKKAHFIRAALQLLEHNYDSERIAAAFGKEDLAERELEKMSPDDVVRVLLVAGIEDYHLEDVAEELKIDVKEVKANAKKMALEEWDEQHRKEGEPARSGKEKK